MNPFKLSDRETEIIEMAARGLTDQAIANELGISLATIGTYWGRVRIKMGPLSRPELVAKFVRQSSDAAVESLKSSNEALQAELKRHLEREQRLEQSLVTVRELLFNAPDAVLFIDPDGVIVEGNAVAAQLLRCHPEDFRGLRVGRFIPESLHEVHRGHREKFFANPTRTQMGDHHGVRVLAYDGSELWVSATVSRAETPQGVLAIVIMRPAA